MFVYVSIRVGFIQSILIQSTKVAPHCLALGASHMGTSVIFSTFEIAIRASLLLTFLKHSFKLLLYLFKFPALKVILMVFCLFKLFFIIVVTFFNFRYLFFAHAATNFHTYTFLAKIEVHSMCFESYDVVRAERARLYSFIRADLLHCYI